MQRSLSSCSHNVCSRLNQLLCLCIPACLFGPLQALAVHIPRSAQCMLMSATSSAEVEELQQLVLHNPVTLNLLTAAAGAGSNGVADGAEPGAAAAAGATFGAGGAGSAAEINHYSYNCSKEDRRLVVLSLLKLGLLKKKVCCWKLCTLNGSLRGCWGSNPYWPVGMLHD